MRLPNLPKWTTVAVAATSIALLPLVGAQAAFDDGDYDLSADCGLDATLTVRGNGNGLDVEGDATLAVGKERVDGEVVGAFVVDLGDEAVADDNVVYTVRPGDDVALSCTFAAATDDEVAGLLGLDADDEPADDEPAEASEASEASGPSEPSAAESDDEAAEKFELCHKPDGANPHEIEVAADAVEAHLAHGDLEGECPEADDAQEGEAEPKGNERAQEKRDERDQRKADREAAKAGASNTGGDDAQD